MDPKLTLRFLTKVIPVLKIQLLYADFAVLGRGTQFFPPKTEENLMLVALVAHLERQIRTRHVEVDLAQGAAIGERAPGRTAPVAHERAAAVGWDRHEGEGVGRVGGMLHVPVCIATVLVEEEVADPARENRVVAR